MSIHKFTAIYTIVRRCTLYIRCSCFVCALALVVPVLSTSPLYADEAPFRHVIVDNEGPKNTWQKTVGDLNGDGFPDLIAGGQASGGLVWYESPNWVKHIIASGGGYGTDAEVADVDRDGHADVISIKDGVHLMR